MKHGVGSPYHKMLEHVTSHFEVNAKVIHNSDVISEVLGCGEMGEPATPFTFREVNPPTPRGRCNHSRDWGVHEGGEGSD